ncbi:MAG: DUF2249 domain-containing protein [Gammaproteobacteria bacterium]|nr:DUF2249 domain-containing protein [Gammaproteobacteria bacterium]
MLQQLPGDGVLKLLARTEPDELLGNLARRGYRASAQPAQDSVWDIEVLCANTPDIADLRELEAPEPMHHVLLAASRLEGKQTYYARLPHVPHPLFPLLEAREFRWWVHEEMDQSALLAVRTGN